MIPTGCLTSKCDAAGNQRIETTAGGGIWKGGLHVARLYQATLLQGTPSPALCVGRGT